VAVATPEGVEEIDTRELARELIQATGAEVRFSAGSRALYANDASVYRQVPLGVVVPRKADDVVAAVEVCRRHGAPVGARGCGTGLAGQSVNTAVMFDFSKHMNEIVELDPERRRARVQPGVVLDWLRDAAEEHELTFGPDPATHSRCTLGGMIGNNSCGTHSILAGVTADNIESLDVLLYDGTRMEVPSQIGEDELARRIAAGGRESEIYAALRDLRDRYADLIRERYPDIPRRVSGYNLERLLPENGFNVAAALVGTEATCALTLEARCKLIHSPQHRALVLLGYEDCPRAADQVPWVMEHGPIGLETFDGRLVRNEQRKGFKRHTELLPGGDAWLLVEFGGDSAEEADGKAERMMAELREGDGPHVDLKLYEDAGEIAQVWEIREGGVGNSKVPGDHPGWPSWEDAAVPPERTGEYLRDLERLCEKHGRRIACYYGHVGHGCVHTRIDFDFLTPEGVENYRRFLEDAAETIAGYGGSLSGEHGDGQARAELLDRMFGPELVGAFREFKAVWDPAHKMNPGKVSDPYPLDTNLRFGPEYHTRHLETHFRFPEDAGSFGDATERCFGVGACRDQNAVMCPSYQVTLGTPPPASGSGPRRAMLWPDTFTDFFEPEVAVAAVETLEAAGFAVELPGSPLCCGRPLYDFGMLKLARRQLRQILAALREPIQSGVPLVALEPSCGAVFRDELVELFPDDPDAKRLARQTRSLAELLHDLGDEWRAPTLERQALVHLHCHQRATTDTDCDRWAIERLGLDAEVLDDGCCGLAGSFGYEPGEPYDVSVAAGERELLPRVREASDSTLVVSDGFSCRSQISHGSERRALHLAQVIQMALRQGPSGPSTSPPERPYAQVKEKA
jgi:FAD/FMN-containing dehydrogenase